MDSKIWIIIIFGMWANGKPPHLGCGHHQGSSRVTPIRGVSLFIAVSTDKINSG
jgi:hypothetical protein